MNFIQAFEYLYCNRASDEEITSPFLLYSKLSDLCGSSYEDKQIITLFYQVDKRINLVQSVLRNEDLTNTKYSQVANLLSEDNFCWLLQTIERVLLPERAQEKKHETEFFEKNSVHAVVTRPETEPKDENSTSLEVVNANATGAYFLIPLGIIIGIVLLTGLLIIFAFVCDWSWTVWQWLLGTVGGLIVSTILLVIMLLLEEERVVRFQVFGSIAVGASILINSVLFAIFKDYYKIMFCCFSVLELVCGILLAWHSFNEFEEGQGAFQLAESAIATLLFVAVMIWA